MTDIKGSGQSSSMESSEEGSLGSSNIEYWVEKGSGKVYASKNEGGQQVFSQPLSESQQHSSPSSLSFSQNSQISQNPQNYERMTSSQFQQNLSSVTSGIGSSKSGS